MSLLNLALLSVLFFSFVLGGLAILPDASAHPVPTAVHDGIYYMYSVFAPLDYLVPIRTILDLFLLSIAFFIALWAWSFIKFVLGLIRGYQG